MPPDAGLRDAVTHSEDPPAPVADPLLAVQAPLRRGEFALAASRLEEFLAAAPADARAWGLLGRCRRLLGALDAADAALTEALRLAPGFAASLRELALLRLAQGRQHEATPLLQRLFAVDPDQPALLWELALLNAAAAPQQALGWLERLRALRPDDPEPAQLQGELLLRTGAAAAALAVFEALAAGDPRSLPALDGAWRARIALDDASPARAALAERLAALAPSPGRWLACAQERAQQGDYRAAHAALDRALALDGGFLPARWAAFQLPEQLSPADAGALEAFRTRWSRGLAEFEALDFRRPELAAQVWDCVGQSTAFHRHYLGDDASGEQRRYGALLARMMAAIAAGADARPLRRRRRRIAVVTAHLRGHTVARLFAPWFEALARRGFEVRVYALAAPSADWLARLAPAVEVVAGPRSWQAWRAELLAAEPDLLLYPEIGMDAMTQGLAALRLAPVQLALWGHPVTSGLPTIDWFAVPEAMEAAGGEAHYSERLLRLPGLGHALEPSAVPAAEAFELPPAPAGTIELLCAQTAYKLLPDQDRLFARLLAARPQARLHLLADDRPAVQAALRERLAAAVAAVGADPDRQLHIHGFLPLPRYLGLAGACALNLDSIGWSGGMSAIDLLGQGLPTVTLPGATLRSRQTAAMLARLGVPELIAADDDDYLRRALALIDDAAARQALCGRLLAARDRLFAEPAAIERLAEFLATVEPGG
jgi:protein O-GlcNAc transferase